MWNLRNKTNEQRKKGERQTKNRLKYRELMVPEGRCMGGMGEIDEGD